MFRPCTSSIWSRFCCSDKKSGIRLVMIRWKKFDRNLLVQVQCNLCLFVNSGFAKTQEDLFNKFKKKIVEFFSKKSLLSAYLKLRIASCVWLLTLLKSLFITSIDLVFIAFKYFASWSFLLANINTTRVVFKQLTFSCDRLCMFIVLTIRHR